MPELSHREKLLAFAGVLIVLFLASLNLTVVGTALPRIIAELEGFQLYAWAFTAYALTSTVSLPIYGKLSDIYGRRGILLAGITIFSLGSALAALVQTMPQLIVLRALQGLGGGALMSMAWATIGDIFTPRERGKYQGFNGAVFGISSVVGPIVGGLITDTIGWRWVFLVNVPVALVAFYFIARHLPRAAPAARVRIDYLGSILLVAGIVPLLLALTWGGVDYPWLSPVPLGMMGLSLCVLTGFVAWQFRSANPILEPELFRDRTFQVANLAGFLTAVGLFGAIIYLPLFIQGVKGGSAAASGFALTPLMFGLVIGSTVSGLLVTRTGRYKPFILAGIATMILGFFLAATMGVSTPIWLVVVNMIILGLGIGPTNSLFVLAVQNALPFDKLGTVTSANQFFRQMGGTVGVAVFGAVVTASVKRLQAKLPVDTDRLSAPVLADLANPNLLTDPAALTRVKAQVEGAAGPGTFEPVLAALRQALGSGLSLVFLVAAALSIVALVVSLRLPVQKLRDKAVAARKQGEARPVAVAND